MLSFNPARWRTDGSALAAAHRLILRAKMGDVYTARLVTTGSIRMIELDRDDAAWEARRKVDGLLRERLRATAKGTSAVAALETLASAHPNLVAFGKQDAYTVTRLNDAHNSLLAALAMEDLARDDRVAATLTPR